MKASEIRTLDLFCGGGGSSIGAWQAGATPIAGIDLWSLATDAFVANHQDAIVFTSDLRSLSTKKVAKTIGGIDLLIASPECTNHSVAKGNKPRSEESKELAFQVIRFARATKPRWIIVENVIQMRNWESYGKWTTELRRLGYFLDSAVLEAESFGVPTTRRRLFVVCDREKQPTLPTPRRLKKPTIRDVIDRGATDAWSFKFTPLRNGRRAEKTIERAERAIAALGDDTEFIMVYYGSDGAGGFQTLDRPLRTITTLDRFALVRPNCVGHEMRMLQPNELALAMGFPKNYKFPETATRRDCIKLIGNAVCPPVMRAVVRALVS